MVKALLLLSGGFDSAVAGYLLKEKNLNLKAIHFSQEPFTDKSPELKSRALAKKLEIKLTVKKISKQLEQIAKKTKRELYFVLMKRLMLREATKIAKRKKIKFLATGENLAQVSSQTLENLAAIDTATKLTILRPLICFNKSEIIKLARQIETFDLSKGPEMCDVLGPKHPSTRVSMKEVLEEEKKTNLTS